MNFDFNLYKIAISIIPIIFAITVHEFAHGWTAKRYGDNTAFSQGRVTLDPFNHIDPIGTILVPLFCYITTSFIFGWAKPVPVNFSRLNNIRADGIKVALAGPLSNFIMAIGWSIILALAGVMQELTSLDAANNLHDMAYIGVSINIIFLLFNLLPIPPLDGGRVLQLTLPYKYSRQLDFLEKYGMMIILVLGFTGILWKLIGPIAAYLEAVLMLPSILSLFSIMLIQS